MKAKVFKCKTNSNRENLFGSGVICNPSHKVPNFKVKQNFDQAPRRINPQFSKCKISKGDNSFCEDEIDLSRSR